jgi:hypothetical protein
MDSNRTAFLDSIEADLTRTTERPRKVSGKARAFAGLLLATGSFLAMSGVAQASPSPNTNAAAQDVVVMTGCAEPDFRPSTHWKTCGLAWQQFRYLRSYSPNGGLVVCHVFEHYSMVCATWQYVRDIETCQWV